MTMSKGRIGQTVTHTGVYRCSVCGFEKEFTEGDVFTDCEVCYDDDLEWELLE